MDIVISSPVPINENWQYWQKLNYSRDGAFSLPTPFTFYTGDHGRIENNEKCDNDVILAGWQSTCTTPRG